MSSGTFKSSESANPLLFAKLAIAIRSGDRLQRVEHVDHICISGAHINASDIRWGKKGWPRSPRTVDKISMTMAHRVDVP